MQVAMVAAGFSASEADQLRRGMATVKFTGGVNKFRDKLIQGMIDNGSTPDFAERTLATRRFRLLRLPGKPCGVICADRLCLKLDEMPPPGCVLYGHPQRTTHGLLSPGPARARRASAWRRDTADRCEFFGMGFHA